MTPENFVYWLQGFFEIDQNVKQLSVYQTKIIKDHLALVLKKETPIRFPDLPPLPLSYPLVQPYYQKPDVTCSGTSFEPLAEIC